MKIKINDIYEVSLCFYDWTLTGCVVMYKNGESYARREYVKEPFWHNTEGFFYARFEEEEETLLENLFKEALKKIHVPESNRKLKEYCYKGIPTTDLKGIRDAWKEVQNED